MDHEDIDYIGEVAHSQKARPKVAEKVFTRTRIIPIPKSVMHSLIIILVAEGWSLGVKNLTNGDVRSEPVYVDLGVERQRMTCSIGSVDI